ncbi:molybdopterin dinucleotide binding domain-containing protein [Ammoniphilus sp. 3BR4]|uniref:molybdopterin dinucleotide binding domain-containing protein n=1 Tax=Ammoniphilus sp. 3BR4 TaxID=3158265 RepID=UPI0034677F05
MSCSARLFSFANVRKLQAIEKEPLLQIHPKDAEEREIADGDPVFVWNERGRCELRAKVFEAMLPGESTLAKGLVGSRKLPAYR